MTGDARRRAGPLPADLGLVLGPGVRRIDEGSVLVGGSPLRVLRMSPAGVVVLDDLVGGAPVGVGTGRQRLARRLLDTGMAHPRPWAPAGAAVGGPVCVVIPVRDRHAGLEATLSALGTATTITVVDDGSGLPVQARTRGHPLTILRHEAPRGPAAARNTGWRWARTDLVAFVDADCEPTPGWLELLVPHFADPAVGAVAPRIIAVPHPRLRRAVAAYESRHSPLDMGPTPSVVRPGCAVPYVPGAALVVRRSAIAHIGGFDESLRFGEDVDLVWRLVRAGWTVRYEPGAVVQHPTRATVAAWAVQRYDYGRSAAALALRHPGAVAPLTISVGSLASWALLATRHPVAAGGVAAMGVGLLGRRLSDLAHPWQEAARLAGAGQAGDARRMAGALAGPWWPLAVGVGAAARTPRAAVVAALTLPALLDWAADRPDIDPVTWCALRLADQVAYGTGVWAGCLRRRSVAALLPMVRRGSISGRTRLSQPRPVSDVTTRRPPFPAPPRR